MTEGMWLARVVRGHVVAFMGEVVEILQKEQEQLSMED